MKAIAAGLLAVALLALGEAPQASAHAQLAVASPAPAAVLLRVPKTISLTFDDALIPQLGANLLRVSDQSRRSYVRSTTVYGATLSATISRLAHYGRYTVTYRVLSADGHPVSGTYDFYWRKFPKGR